MTSPKLQIIARQMARHQQPERAPAPESGLGAAIEQLVQQAVQEQVADAIEQRKPPAHVRRLMDEFNKPEPTTDYRELPPVARTAPKKPLNLQLHRDGSGVIRWMECNGVKFKAIRDGADVLLGVEQIDESPILLPPDIDYKAEARTYDPGTPRT